MLREFALLHSDARSPLAAWRKEAKRAEWTSFAEVKATFGSRVDRYKKFVIFDFGGNKYRLIAVIHYNTGCVYLRYLLTHRDYDRGKWKDD
jgi:mRNA interferase HigB